MFATILRRWRLGVPLALVSLLSMMMAGGMLTTASAASAHKLHFAFAGDTAAFVDLTVQPQFIECFSGQVESDTADLNRTGFIGEDDACATPFLDSVDGVNVARAGAAVARIRSDHTRVEGHTISQSEVIGDVAIFGVDDATLLAAAHVSPFGIDIDTPVAIECTTFFPISGCQLHPELTPRDCQDLGFDTCRLVGPDVEAGDFARSQAEAECEKKHGHNAGHASVLGLSQFDDLDMESVFAGLDDVVRELKPTAFTFTGGSVQFVTQGEDGATIVLIVNESTRLVSDDFGAISVNALHFIEQDGAGFIGENVLVAHSFAQIHCHGGRFDFEDGIGA